MRRLLGNRVYLDSNLLIYLFNATPDHAPSVARIMELASAAELTAVTGDLTVTEVLVRPLAADDTVAVASIRAFLDTGPIEICSHSRDAFELAARVRASRRTSLPDALHAATAVLTGCTHLVTNDARMPSVPGLQVVRLQDLEELPG